MQQFIKPLTESESFALVDLTVEFIERLDEILEKTNKREETNNGGDVLMLLLLFLMDTENVKKISTAFEGAITTFTVKENGK